MRPGQADRQAGTVRMAGREREGQKDRDRETETQQVRDKETEKVRERDRWKERPTGTERARATKDVQGLHEAPEP